MDYERLEHMIPPQRPSPLNIDHMSALVSIWAMLEAEKYRHRCHRVLGRKAKVLVWTPLPLSEG
jgi:hypothetical protein